MVVLGKYSTLYLSFSNIVMWCMQSCVLFCKIFELALLNNTVVRCAVCRSELEPETERSICQSGISDPRDAKMKLSLQIVSPDDAEFENVLREAIVNGN